MTGPFMAVLPWRCLAESAALGERRSEWASPDLLRSFLPDAFRDVAMMTI